MRVEGITEIPIKRPYSKGVVDDSTFHRIPDQYSTSMKNLRIQNGTVTLRKGLANKFNLNGFTGEFNGGIVVKGFLYSVIGSEVVKTELANPGTSTKLGDIVKPKSINYENSNYGGGTSFVAGDTVSYEPTGGGTPLWTSEILGTTHYGSGEGIIYFESNSAGTSLGYTLYGSKGKNGSSPGAPGGGAYQVGITSPTQRVSAELITLSIIPAEDIDTYCNFVHKGRYIGIFSGETAPYLIDTELDTLTIKMPTNDISGADTKVPAEFSPKYAGEFGGHVFAGYENTVYISHPILISNQQDILNFQNTNAGTSGYNTTQIALDSDIKAIKVTQTRVYIWTEDMLYFVDKSSATFIQTGELTFITTPLSDSGKIISDRSIVEVGNKIFYMTDTRKIKSVNYIEGTVNLEIGEITDMENLSVDGIIDDLDPIQTHVFGIYDKDDNVCKWFCKRKFLPENEFILCYDLVNQTFFLDEFAPDSNIRIKGSFETKERNYLVNFANNTVYLDNEGVQDDGEDIEWERISARHYMGDFFNQKTFRHFSIGGWLRNARSFDLELFVDGVSVLTRTIARGGGISDFFEERISRGSLFKRGKYIQEKVSGTNQTGDFSLEGRSIGAKSYGITKLSDK